MKSKSLLLSLPIISLVLIFAISSCIEEMDFPVETCTFSDSTSNATNPNNVLYQEVLDEFVAKGLPGISVAIETPEHGWWVGSAGMARIEDETALNPCHTFNIESMSKPYIAVLILRLYEVLELQIEDPIREYLPEDIVENIANADQATIRQLLNHTSGIVDLDAATMYVDIFNEPLYPATLEQQFERYVYGKPAGFTPGEGYRYSNTGYALLGMIVEAASGMSLGDYFEQEISAPLGLTNTYYRSSANYPDIENLANAYAEIHPGQLTNVTDIEKNDMILSMGQGGVITNPYENAIFLKELMKGTLLEPATLELMLTEEIEVSDDYTRGLGIGHYIGESRTYGEGYGHSGGYVGYRSEMIYFPDTEVTFSLATNSGSVLTGKNTNRFGPLLMNLLSVTFTGERE